MISCSEAYSTAEETVVLDPPGQPELTTHHMSLPRILQNLEKLGYRVRTYTREQCTACANEGRSLSYNVLIQ